MFLVNSDDSRTAKGQFNSVYYIVISDKNSFLEADKGGAIYTLLNDSFYCDLKKGMGKKNGEAESLLNLSKKLYKSGLRAMINTWVQVYFVDKVTFKKIKKAKRSRTFNHQIFIIRESKVE